MNFIFSWQKQYFTHSLRSFVKYCFCHSKIKFISSRHRVISSIYLSIMINGYVYIIFDTVNDLSGLEGDTDLSGLEGDTDSVKTVVE